MKINWKMLLACSLSFALSATVNATIRSSANYKIDSDGISSAQQMSSANYQLFSIAGDTRIIGEATSASYFLGGGTIYVINPSTNGVDTDGDGIPDDIELLLGLDPLLIDSDNDGISDANEDFDGDGVGNLTEIILGTDPADNASVPVDSFTDIAPDHPLYLAVEVLARVGIVEGCSFGYFCPDEILTRDAISKWILKAMNGSSYIPETAAFSSYTDINVGNPSIFDDGDFNSDWIEQYRADGMTEGCNIANTLYCPSNVVTRAVAAQVLLRARDGNPAYAPPTAASDPFADVSVGIAGVFGDGDFASDWIAELSALGITQGCDGDDLGDGLNYCPDQAMTKAEFANLLMRAFDIQL